MDFFFRSPAVSPLGVFYRLNLSDLSNTALNVKLPIQALHEIHRLVMKRF